MVLSKTLLVMVVILQEVIISQSVESDIGFGVPIRAVQPPMLLEFRASSTRVFQILVDEREQEGRNALPNEGGTVPSRIREILQEAASIVERGYLGTTCRETDLSDHDIVGLIPTLRIAWYTASN